MVNKVCNKCGYRVSKSKVRGYSYFCPQCFEDLYRFEVRNTKKEYSKYRSKKRN